MEYELTWEEIKILDDMGALKGKYILLSGGK